MGGSSLVVKLNIVLLDDPPVPVLGTYPSDLNCMWMFIATLFTVARNWEQTRCLLVGQWINRLWYIPTGKYYSTKWVSYQAVKLDSLIALSSRERNESQLCVVNIRSPSEKSPWSMIPYMWRPGKGKAIEVVSTPDHPVARWLLRMWREGVAGWRGEA